MPAVLIYDRACGFCTRWVQRWRARTGKRVLYLPLQTPLLPRLLGVSKRRARKAIQLVERPGRVHSGARAVLRVLSRMPNLRLLARVGLLPGVRSVLELGYRIVARNRTRAAMVDRLLFGRGTRPLRYRYVRWAFLRGLGLVYLVAFTSLRLQVRGLYGKRGIEPMQEYLDAIAKPLGRKRLRYVPSLFWGDASDRTLVGAATAGQLAALLLLVDVFPFGAAAAAWLLYLSFYSAGQDFLGFQWDSLLLETGAHAFTVCPGGLRPGLGDAGPSWHAVALMRLFALRFHFEAGLAKVKSGDKVWKERRALEYHYETQPLPTRAGWYAHHLPKRVQRLSTQAALGIELFSPFLIVLPRRLRRAAFGLQVLLQGTIALTGNYGFFNLLTVVLSLWMLDDEPFERFLGRGKARAQPRWSRRARVPFEAGLALLNALELWMRVRPPLPEWARKIVGATRPFSVPGSYGLFAMMTVTRPEIVIEGSDDGKEWKEYGFRYKPGPVDHPPRQAAPHQPRLDWQMWFAALGTPPRWFLSLLVRLLQGAPEVLALFDTVPFDHPPKSVRARFYVYNMADLETHRRTGAWWTREPIGLYFPAIALPEEEEESAEERALTREEQPEQRT